MDNQNYENELVEFYAKGLIENLGSKYSLESMNDYYADPTYHGEYEEYGFKIAIGYKNKKYDEYQRLNIKFYGQKVYDTDEGILIHGTWQEALAELYKKIPNILNKKEESKKRIDHARELYENYIEPITNRVGRINDSLVLGSYSTYDPYGGYGNTTTYHKTVKKDDEIVLDIVDRIYSFYVDSYTPGDWENEIIDFYHKYNNSETEEEHLSAVRVLKDIRNI